MRYVIVNWACMRARVCARVFVHIKPIVNVSFWLKIVRYHLFVYVRMYAYVSHHACFFSRMFYEQETHRFFSSIAYESFLFYD